MITLLLGLICFILGVIFYTKRKYKKSIFSLFLAIFLFILTYTKDTSTVKVNIEINDRQNSSNCHNTCQISDIGPRGERGERGDIGPQGPPGTSGITTSSLGGMPMIQPVYCLISRLPTDQPLKKIDELFTLLNLVPFIKHSSPDWRGINDSELIIPESGTYKFDLFLRFQDGTITGDGGLGISVSRNGNEIIPNFLLSTLTQTSANRCNVNISYNLDFLSGDIIKLWAINTSGGEDYLKQNPAYIYWLDFSITKSI